MFPQHHDTEMHTGNCPVCKCYSSWRWPPEHAGLFWLAGHQLAIPGLTLPTACLDIVTSALADPCHAVLAPSHVDGWASCCLHSAFQHTVPETPVKPLSVCASAGS